MGSPPMSPNWAVSPRFSLFHFSPDCPSHFCSGRSSSNAFREARFCARCCFGTSFLCHSKGIRRSPCKADVNRGDPGRGVFRLQELEFLSVGRLETRGWWTVVSNLCRSRTFVRSPFLEVLKTPKKLSSVSAASGGPDAGSWPLWPETLDVEVALT